MRSELWGAENSSGMTKNMKIEPKGWWKGAKASQTWAKETKRSQKGNQNDRGSFKKEQCGQGLVLGACNSRPAVLSPDILGTILGAIFDKSRRNVRKMMPKNGTRKNLNFLQFFDAKREGLGMQKRGWRVILVTKYEISLVLNFVKNDAKMVSKLSQNESRNVVKSKN